MGYSVARVFKLVVGYSDILSVELAIDSEEWVLFATNWTSVLLFEPFVDALQVIVVSALQRNNFNFWFHIFMADSTLLGLCQRDACHFISDLPLLPFRIFNDPFPFAVGAAKKATECVLCNHSQPFAFRAILDLCIFNLLELFSLG